MKVGVLLNPTQTTRQNPILRFPGALFHKFRGPRASSFELAPGPFPANVGQCLYAGTARPCPAPTRDR